MSKQRYIDTKIWSDTWISDLDPIEKLLFFYILTNERTNIAGIYELPLKIMAVETGIEIETIKRVLNRFEKDKKVIYLNGWIGIKNFIKHQDIKNEKILKGINLILEDIPTDILDTLSIPYIYPLNNTNTNTNIIIKSSNDDPHNQINELFNLYTEKYKEWISDEKPIFNWGACEKLAKPHIKNLGLERMKHLLLFYLKYADDKDREFWKKNAYSLQVFLSANTLNILNTKYGTKQYR